MNNWPELFDNLPKNWKEFLIINPEWLKSLSNFLTEGYINFSDFIFPAKTDIFSAFSIDPSKLKCVILGQDPYHGKNQAHGLSFSVKPGIEIPPSLKNIFEELKNDLGINIPNSGYLEKWKDQGVFLLNTILTVEKSKPKSHENKGWNLFTDSVIKSLSIKRENLIFILWGSNAISYSQYIDKSKHLIIKSSHPSPYSANQPSKIAPSFFGSRPFSKTNQFLKKNGISEIDWNL